MENHKISILFLTLDRYYLTKYVLEHILSISGHDNVEILILDNGSEDKRVIDYYSSLADVHIVEEKNIGIPAAINKLLRQATSDYFCKIDGDVIFEKDWLKDLLYWNRKIEKSGITGIHCIQDKGVYFPQDKIWVRPDNIVFTTFFFSRAFLNDVGGFDESLGIYGKDDAQLCIRASQMGYTNFYIPNQFSTHLGEDYNTHSEYRKMKDANLKIAEVKFKESIERMIETKNFRIPL